MKTPSYKLPISLLAPVSTISCASQNDHQYPENASQDDTNLQKSQDQTTVNPDPVERNNINKDVLSADSILIQDYADTFAAGVLDIITDTTNCQGFLTVVGKSIQARTSKQCIENYDQIKIMFKARANFDAEKYKIFEVNTLKKNWSCDRTGAKDPGCSIDFEYQSIVKLVENGFSLKPSVYNSTISLDPGTLLITPNKSTGEWTIHSVVSDTGREIFTQTIGQTQTSTSSDTQCLAEIGAPTFLAEKVCSKGECGVQLQTYRGFAISVGHASVDHKLVLEDGKECSANVKFTR